LSWLPLRSMSTRVFGPSPRKRHQCVRRRDRVQLVVPVLAAAAPDAAVQAKSAVSVNVNRRGKLET
jgi:hypothetical protein